MITVVKCFIVHPHELILYSFKRVYHCHPLPSINLGHYPVRVGSNLDLGSDWETLKLTRIITVVKCFIVHVPQLGPLAFSPAVDRNVLNVLN